MNRDRVRRLRPGESFTVSSIEIRRMADNDLRYCINTKIDGARIHRVLGFAGEGMNFRQAKLAVEALRMRAREGRLQLPTNRKLARTLSEAVPVYLAKLEAGEGGGKNIDRKRMQFELHLLPFLGRKRLPELTRGDFERYRKHREEEGAANATVNRELMAASHLLSCAVEWKWLAAKPCRMPLVKEEEPTIAVFDAAICDALIHAALNDANSYAYLFIAFGLNTAMRHSEILASRYDRIDWSRRRLEIPQAKAGRRSQPLTPALCDILAREREQAEDPDGWIFPSQRPELGLGHAGHQTRMDRPFARVVKALGLKATPHVMRHSAISRLIAGGADIPTVMKIGGHKTVTMVLRYTHVADPKIDEAMLILNRGVPEFLPRSYHARPEAPSVRPGNTAQVLVFPKKN
jgi:integrase